MLPPPNETTAMRWMREIMGALLLSPPWIMTWFILTADHSAMPPVLVDQLKAFPPITAEQIAAYCAKERAQWTLPNWRDPECLNLRDNHQAVAAATASSSGSARQAGTATTATASVGSRAAISAE